MKHKRLLALMAAALTGVTAAAIPVEPGSFACLTAFAESGENLGKYHSGHVTDHYGNTFYFDYYDKSDGVTIYDSWSGAVKAPGYDAVIPAVVDDKPVTKIDAMAFNGEKFNSLVVPDTVREIGARAFEACTISTIQLPSSLEKIGDYAFSRAWLTKITIPAGVSVIRDSTFAGCDLMKSVSMEGVTYIEQDAFLNCNQLEEIVIREDCRVQGTSAPFHECRSIQKINGHMILGHETDENGISYPVLDPYAYPLVKRFFAQCSGVKFVDDYCEELCKYVVKTETSYDPDIAENPNDWMCDALKARQLHDWLLRHCEFNKAWRQSATDMRNFNYSAFFLSYAMSENGVGKAVCSSYSKAYTMLLHAAGIESAVVGDNEGEGHAWNVVKINNNGVFRYYEVDTLWDDQQAEGEKYKHFLKSDADMTAIHQGWVLRELDSHEGEHAWLDDFTGDCEYLKAQCSESFEDANGDGILDYDFDLDGVPMRLDTADDMNSYQGYLGFAYGFEKSTDQINDKLGDAFANLHALHMSFWDYADNCGAHDVTVADGEIAEFTTSVFGENLHYQWYVYIPRFNRWDFIENERGIQKTLRLYPNEYPDGTKFICSIQNQNCYLVYTYPVTLTVV